MKPIKIACRHVYLDTTPCGAGVGQDCVAMGLERGTPPGDDGKWFHAERRMDAAMCVDGSAEGEEPSVEAFDRAVEESGLV